MRHGLAAALTGVATLGALAFTSSPTTAAPRPAPTLTVAVPGPFGGCDPGSATTTVASDDVLSLVLPSAFTAGAASTPVGDTEVVAQAEVVSLNPQTVVYTITPGARWPDGTAFSAADLVRTWRDRRAGDLVADLGYRDVASLTPSPNGMTLTVVFSTPYSDWESLFNGMVPAATAGTSCVGPTAALDPSMGPYEIEAASPTSISLAANPRWTGTKPYYAHVVVTTDPARVVRTGSGPRLVYLPSPTLAELQALDSTGALQSRMLHDTTVVSLDFAVRGGHALPLLVREALARVIDRHAIVDAVDASVDSTGAPAVSHLFGQGEFGYLGPVGSPVGANVAPTPGVPGATGAAAYGDLPDATLAGALLRADGLATSHGKWLLADGRPLEVCLAVPTDVARLVPTAQLVLDELRTAGVTVDWRPVGTTTGVVDALRAGTCSAGLMTRTGDGFVTHEAAAWIPPTPPVPVDVTWTGVGDPIVSAAAITATGMLNPVTAATTWTAMDARLWNVMVGLPLYSPSVFVGWTPDVAGFLDCDTLACVVDQVPSLVQATKP